MSTPNNSKPTPISSSMLRSLSTKLKQSLGKSDPINIGKHYHLNGEEPIEYGTWDNAKTYISKIKYLVPGWIPYGMLTIVMGESGMGKSTFVLYSIVNSVVTGEKWFTGAGGPKPSKVLWCDTESSTGLNLGRLEEWGRTTKGIITPFKDELKPICLDDPEHLELMERLVVQEKIKLVVIDALANATSIPENDARIAKPLYAVSSIGEKTGAAILVNLHNRKPSALSHSYEEMTIHSIRGSSAIVGTSRCVIGIDRPDSTQPDWVKIYVIKQNIAAKPAPIGMHWLNPGIEFGPAPQVRRKVTESDTAKDWLREKMVPGKTYKSSVFIQEALRSGIAKRTLQRAAKELGIKTIAVHKNGKIAYHNWVLP